MQLDLLTIEALEMEEHLVFSGVTDDGDTVDSEACSKLFGVAAELGSAAVMPEDIATNLKTGITTATD